jgi:Uma2 family endonuclease
MSVVPSSQDLVDVPLQLDGRVRPSLRMTEEELEAWAGDMRAEWVDGEVILMSPSNLIHVRLQTWFLSILSLFVEQKELGEILGPDFTIRFAKQRRRRVPDLLFLSTERASLLRPALLEGAPDLAVEIVSPDSQSRDRRDKFLEYEKAGVREYWIIDPLSQTVEAYSLASPTPGASSVYALIPEHDGRIASTVLQGFYLKPAWLWQVPLPGISNSLREMGIQL